MINDNGYRIKVKKSVIRNVLLNIVNKDTKRFQRRLLYNI